VGGWPRHRIVGKPLASYPVTILVRLLTQAV
jgi:hypothetical protein